VYKIKIQSRCVFLDHVIAVIQEVQRKVTFPLSWELIDYADGRCVKLSTVMEGQRREIITNIQLIDMETNHYKISINGVEIDQSRMVSYLTERLVQLMENSKRDPLVA